MSSLKITNLAGSPISLRFPRSSKCLQDARLWCELFKAAKSGAFALEFSIVVMPFFAFIFLIFQVSIYRFGVQTLDFATAVAARSVMTGNFPAAVYTASEFKTNLLCPNITAVITCDDIIVNAYKLEATSDSIKSADINKFIDARLESLGNSDTGSTFCLGGEGDYIFIDVSYKISNIVGRLITESNKGKEGILISSSAFIRNEPEKTRVSAC